MKVKRVLRFYFKAEELDGALNNLIMTVACRSVDCQRGGEFSAERIIALIDAKRELSELWNYLDGVISALDGVVIETLKGYAESRCGIKRLEPQRQREIKRAVIKFTRHARAIGRFDAGVRLVGEYYCLI